MATHPLVTPRRSALHRTRRGARAAAEHPWMEHYSRFGYFIRGVINLMPGVVALELASGSDISPITRTGAIELLGSQPLGRIYLVIVALGLLGYSLWGVIRAVFDPLEKGTSASGLFTRLGYASSALAHGALFAATLRYLAGQMAGVGNGHDWTADLLAHPLGAWLVGIVGLCWMIGGGIVPIVDGWHGTFQRDLDLARVKSAERRFAREIGRIGMAGRGFVGVLVGSLLVASALHLNFGNESGMDGALLELAGRPHGRALLALAALGLIAYGIYSMLCARWMRMTHPDRPRRLHAHGSRPPGSVHG